jgi:predicted nucleic acid-binding protein
MKSYFADTSYYLALLLADDELNEKALRLTPRLQGKIVTTSWVLTEVADALCRPRDRKFAIEFIREIRQDSDIHIIPPTQDLFDRGIALYSRRHDKSWSLTDCISFVAMKNYRLKDALSSDIHFEQAGFNALLRQ